MKHMILITLFCLGCSSGIDDKSGNNAANNVNNVQNNANNVVDYDLSDLEWSLVGTWRTCAYADDKCQYMILEPNRVMCTWDRDGDNFSQRFDEVHFHNWRLVEDDINDEGQMLFNVTNDNRGEVWDDRYNPETDQMYHPWIPNSPFGMSWVNNIILCSDSNIQSIASDIERLGVLGNGDTTDTRLENSNNQNNTTPNNTNPEPNNADNNSNNETTGPMVPGGGG